MTLRDRPTMATVNEAMQTIAFSLSEEAKLLFPTPEESPDVVPYDNYQLHQIAILAAANEEMNPEIVDRLIEMLAPKTDLDWVARLVMVRYPCFPFSARFASEKDMPKGLERAFSNNAFDERTEQTLRMMDAINERKACIGTMAYIYRHHTVTGNPVGSTFVEPLLKAIYATRTLSHAQLFAAIAGGILY